MADTQIDKGTFIGWLREAFADFGNGSNKTIKEIATSDLQAMEQRLETKFADQRDARVSLRVSSPTTRRSTKSRARPARPRPSCSG